MSPQIEHKTHTSDTEMDRTLLRAIESGDWGLIILASAVESGYGFEMAVKAATVFARCVASVLIWIGITLLAGDDSCWPDIVGAGACIVSAPCLVELSVLARRFLALQRRRTKFKLDTLEMVLSGRREIDAPAEE